MIGGVLAWIDNERRGLWLALGLFAVLLVIGWVGFIGSDDVTYARGAYGWIEHFPYVGGHGTIRYPITIPMAVSFSLLGGNEYAMVLPSLLYLIAFFVVAWKVVREIAGGTTAFAALIAVVTAPLIVIQSTIAGVDVIEMALVFGALMLVWRCLDQGPSAGRMIGAGALVGVAFLTRETAIFVVPFFGLLFLAGHGIPRLQYLWMAPGFLGVWALELAYLGIMTGDPFYRFNISLHHDSTIDRSVDVAGNVIVHPLVDPLLVLMFNQEFMLLLAFAIPLGIWLCFAHTIAPRLQHFARLVALFGLCWFVCVGAAQHLLPLNPRYFMITSAMLCLLAGIGIGQLLQAGRTWLGLSCLLVLVGTNLVGILVENRDPMFGERELAHQLEVHPGRRIATDPMTLYRAELLLRWNGAALRVDAEPPRPGQLYYYNPARSAQANARMSEARLPLFRPGEQWHLVATYHPHPDLLARALEGTGLYAVIPPRLWNKLRYRHLPTYLYEVR